MIGKILGAGVAAAALSVSNCSALAQEGGGDAAALDRLIGEWSLTTTYANGAVGRGERVCARALEGAYIRCDSTVTFDGADVTRLSVSYVNYNERRDVFEEVGMWQFPPAKKLTDIAFDESGDATARGYIYAGEGEPGRRVYELWTLGDDAITITVKSNTRSQPPDAWPLFLEDKLIRKGGRN